MVYDVTLPTAPVFETFISPFKTDGTSKDAGVEGLIFVAAKQSHTGKNLLIASHEVSGTTTIFQIDDLLPSEIKEQKSIVNDFNFYPNPSQNAIQITLKETAKGSIVKVWNTMGQVILSQEMNEQTINLDIASLAKGLYILSIGNEANQNIVSPKKLIKQ
jgi:hypothetical protein